MILSIKAISLKCLAKELNSVEFVVNEVKHVENLLRDKKVTPRKVMKELRLIVQYYLSKGCSKEETVELVVQFMSDVNGNDSGEKWRRRIESTVKDIISKQDYKLRDIEEIHITNSELETIKSLDDDKLRRYAFGLLVYCKVINYKKDSLWVELDKTTVFCRDIKVKLPNMEAREKMFKALQDSGLTVTSRKAGSLSLQVLFINKKEENIVHSISTIPNTPNPEETFINNCMIFYDNYFNGKRYYVCQCCGKYDYVQKRSKPKYCPKCAEEIKRGRVVING